MDTINISPERFQQALSWINGQASTLGEQEVLQMLRALTGRFQENCRALRPGPVPRFRNLRLTPHPLSLTAIAAEVEADVKAKRKVSPSPRGVCDIVVENCKFVNPSGYIFYAKNGSGFVLRGNEVEWRDMPCEKMPFAGEAHWPQAAETAP